jgi:hypothetical protein
MTNWQVSESGTTVGLDEAGRGTATITVTNPGPDEDRVVLTVSPLEGAARGWFTVEEPQRLVGGGDSVVFQVRVDVPAGTAEGTYAFQAVAYSADRDPGETSATSRRMTFEVAPSPAPFPWWIPAVLALLAIAGVLAWLLTRDGDDGPPTTTETTDTTVSTDTTDTTVSTDTTDTTETTEPPPVTDPSGPDLFVEFGGECDVIPGGALGGGDVLNILVRVRNAGPGTVDRLVPMLVESDTGLQATSNTSVGTGSAVNAMQVTLPQDAYGRTHRFTITADPANEIIERDVSNNAIRVTVQLPTRPASFTVVPCSSP